MPTITVPDETYDRIPRRAEALGTTVEALVVPALEQIVEGPQVNAQFAAALGESKRTRTVSTAGPVAEGGEVMTTRDTLFFRSRLT